jgi:uncharacterized membrane protein
LSSYNETLVRRGEIAHKDSRAIKAMISQTDTSSFFLVFNPFIICGTVLETIYILKVSNESDSVGTGFAE